MSGEHVGHKCVHPQKRQSAFRACEDRLACETFRSFEQDVNTMVERDRRQIAEKSLDAYQNNELIEGGIGYHVDATVGSGGRWRLCPEPDIDGMDPIDRAEFIRRIKKLWKKHTTSPRYWIDGEGKKTHTQLVRSFTKTYLWRGEAAATIQWRESENRPFRTAINVIDPSRIRDDDRMSDREKSERRIVGGIEHTASGYPLGYFVHRGSDRSVIDRRNQRPDYIRRKNALGRDQLVHIHRGHLPELSRGISQLVACLKTLRCLEMYSDKTLEAAILQTLIAVTIESDYDDAGQLFASDDGEQVSGSLQYMSEAGQFHSDMKARGKEFKFGDNVRAGRLWNKERLNMTQPNQPVQQYGNYVGKLEEKFARCFGHTYATLTQDWSQTNFSGARAGFIGVNRFVESLSADCAEPFSCITYCAWMEDVLTSGELAVPNMDTATASLRFYTERDSWTCCRFRGPAKEEIDKAKQATGFLTEQKLGAFTLDRYSDVVLGEDWRDVVDQQCIEEAYIAEKRANEGLPPLPPVDPRSAVNSEQLLAVLNNQMQSENEPGQISSE